jgi:hypothetical protein
MSLSAHCLLPRGVSRVGALLCWSLENCTGSERDRPCRHVLICQFAAGPGEPQPINGSDEQMFGVKQQVPHEEQSYQEAGTRAV